MDIHVNIYPLWRNGAALANPMVNGAVSVCVEENVMVICVSIVGIICCLREYIHFSI